MNEKHSTYDGVDTSPSNQALGTKSKEKFLSRSAKFRIVEVIAGVVIAVTGIITMFNGFGSKFLFGTSENNSTVQIEITRPSNEATVPYRARVEGSSLLSGKNHYVVVHPLESNRYWLQEDTPMVSDEGTVFGFAQFGDGDAGIGQDFVLEIMATASKLQAGSYERRELPGDAVFSAPMFVTRK